MPFQMAWEAVPKLQARVVAARADGLVALWKEHHACGNAGLLGGCRACGEEIEYALKGMGHAELPEFRLQGGTHLVGREGGVERIGRSPLPERLPVQRMGCGDVLDILRRDVAPLQKAANQVLSAGVERPLQQRLLRSGTIDPQILHPPRAENNTPWPSVVRTPGFENRDLLAEAIAKGRERGLKVYAWMFSLNFGHTYAQRPGAEQILARNGRGQTSMTFNGATGINSLGEVVSEEVFIDPYHPQAKLELYNLAQALARRRPDGM